MRDPSVEVPQHCLLHGRHFSAVVKRLLHLGSELPIPHSPCELRRVRPVEVVPHGDPQVVSEVVDLTILSASVIDVHSSLLVFQPSRMAHLRFEV